MKIAIIGYGHVGKAMSKRFPDAYIYDKYLKMGNLKELNQKDVAFVCVPTPQSKSGACDTSIVEDIIKNINVNLFVLRSTVYIGFTDKMTKKYNKKIVFQPEYYGETIDHPLSNLTQRKWLAFGGKQDNIDMAIEVYKTIINSNIKIIQASAKEVEFAKYMENAYLATKVTFVNEMYDIAEKMKLNYNISREIWLEDPRITASHTFVYKNNRGYGGKCLPKDISSLIYQSEQNNVNVDFLKSIIRKNNSYKK